MAWLKPDWKDMSEYLVHFTEEREALPPLPDDASPRAKAYHEIRRQRTPYWNFLSFLWDRRLKPSDRRFGAAKNEAWLGESQRAVCLSEVPLPFVRRIADRRKNRYGIGFTQTFARQQGAARVWYLDKDEPAARAFGQLFDAHKARRDPDDPFWEITPFVDRPGTYPTRWRPRPNRFEWEREWRVPGPEGLQFEPADVAFLFLPHEEHDLARDFFTGHAADNTGPAYFCPYIDPYWDDATIREALTSTSPTQPPSHTD